MDGDFRSINDYLGKLTPRELQVLETAMHELEASRAWPALRTMLRAEREQHVRNMSLRVLEHAEYAHHGGVVKGLVGVESIVAMVKHKANEVRAAGGFSEAETGSEGNG